MPTHDKHIFVRPKMRAYYEKSAYLRKKVLILGGGRFLIFRTPARSQISTFSLGQKGCAYYGKSAFYDCAYYEWAQYNYI